MVAGAALNHPKEGLLAADQGLVCRVEYDSGFSGLRSDSVRAGSLGGAGHIDENRSTVLKA